MSDLAFSIENDSRRWDRLRAEVHAWRGEMLDIFTRAEFSVGETLHLAGCEGQKYRLVGPKFAKLADMVGDGGVLEKIGRQVRRELAEFRTYDPLRTTLCHGKVTVAVDEAGDWIAIFRLLVFGNTATDHEVVVFEKADALTKRDMLRARQTHLTGQLRAMQKHIPVKT